MSNYEYYKFKQSINDFPVGVSLGGRVPSWGLSRSGTGLRFGALDDEGYAVRGDSRRLLYKGRERSHRFTILNDNSFEYDVILKKEPVSNVIELFIDSAENYEFCRQPDFVPNDFLKGSYAVYRKERVVGQGTGKLCHIHRPKIIDAARRWVWGELLVVGNRLLITIPETWLSDARYPVIVDPIVGCSQIGSQTMWDPEFDGKLCEFIHEERFILHDFFITQQISAQSLTAHYYSRYVPDRGDLGGIPIMYSDKDYYPYQRYGENYWLSFENGRDGWVDTDFYCGSVAANTTVWFGLRTYDCWAANFDYGSTQFASGETYGKYQPSIFPDYGFDFYNLNVSMYLQWGTVGQNYVRTITQGVTLNDSRKRLVDYRKAITTSLGASTNTANSIGFVRSLAASVSSTDTFSHLTGIVRKLQECVTGCGIITEGIKTLCRTVIDYFTTLDHRSRSVGYHIKLVTTSFVRDYFISRFLIARDNVTLKSRITRDVVLRSTIR